MLPNIQFKESSWNKFSRYTIRGIIVVLALASCALPFVGNKETTLSIGVILLLLVIAVLWSLQHSFRHLKAFRNNTLILEYWGSETVVPAERVLSLRPTARSFLSRRLWLELRYLTDKGREGSFTLLDEPAYNYLSLFQSHGLNYQSHCPTAGSEPNTQQTAADEPGHFAAVPGTDRIIEAGFLKLLPLLVAGFLAHIMPTVPGTATPFILGAIIVGLFLLHRCPTLLRAVTEQELVLSSWGRTVRVPRGELKSLKRFYMGRYGEWFLIRAGKGWGPFKYTFIFPNMEQDLEEVFERCGVPVTRNLGI